MKNVAYIAGVVVVFFALLGVLIVGGRGCAVVDEAGSVAQSEFGAKASLRKYEWFVDQANRIDKMDANITLYELRAETAKNECKRAANIVEQMTCGETVKRTDEELIAIKTQRNNLVAEYNAASEKFNWSLYNTREDKPREVYVLR